MNDSKSIKKNQRCKTGAVAGGQTHISRPLVFLGPLLRKICLVRACKTFSSRSLRNVGFVFRLNDLNEQRDRKTSQEIVLNMVNAAANFGTIS